MLFFSIGDIMATRFLRINDDFRDSLEETLDRNNCSGKVRPYYCGIGKTLLYIGMFNKNAYDFS